MTSVSQLIPTYATGGISDQPDELKRPGQVRDAVNVYPDLTEGLIKRPGLNKLADLMSDCFNIKTHKNGSWFSFFRENSSNKLQEKFIGHVSYDGVIDVWNVKGEPVKVYYSEDNIVPEKVEEITLDDLTYCDNSDLPYLKHKQQDFLQFTSINNYTFITNPGVGVTMSSNTSEKRPYEAFVEITQLVYGREYRFDIDLINTDDTVLIKSAAEIEIINVGNFSSGSSTDPSCPAQWAKTVTLGEDDLKRGEDKGQADLQIRIESTGVLEGDGDGYRCIYRHTAELVNGGRNIGKNNIFRARQDQLPDNPPFYDIKVKEISRNRTSSDYAITGVTTASDGNTVESIGDILTELKDKVDSGTDNNFTTEVVGNGLYITSDKPFSVSTSEKDLFNILANSDDELDNPYVVVNNVSRLPVECKDGIVAKVANAFSDDDDYWVQFKADYGSDVATGHWEEVPEPGGKITLNAGTMPHALFYARENGETVFIAGPCEWKSRDCGTEDFNPSFVDFPINNLIFYRNRLVALSQENVIMTRAGELFNFFPVSALAVSAKDPIDITATTNYSSVLQDALVINNGLVIFSNFQQFLFTTDSDVLDPTTAKISEIARYDYDITSRPINLGVNIGFYGSNADNSRFYEMFNIFREGPVDIIERSKIVNKSISSGLNIIADSKETGLILSGKREDKTVWCYRYFKESSQRELQSAWFKWQLPHELVFHTIIEDTYFCVMAMEDDTTILASLEVDNTEGPWQDLGEEMEMSIELPTVYVTKTEQQAIRADTTSSLIVHRMHFNTGATNYYTVTTKRHGKDDYVVRYDQSMQDGYLAGADPVSYDREEVVPVYERNINFNSTITSNYNGPFTLYSMRWEGDYNPRYYKRV